MDTSSKDDEELNMIIIVTGPTHAGKTKMAQMLLEKTHYPYLSEDHLKMGLIRTGMTSLTPNDDREMTAFLWPIVREMIKTAIENKQNLIVEGCYIPFNWQDDFSEVYLKDIKFICLCFSEKYLKSHFLSIKAHANCIEKRVNDLGMPYESLKRENEYFHKGCIDNNLNVVVIESEFNKTLTSVVDTFGRIK